MKYLSTLLFIISFCPESLSQEVAFTVAEKDLLPEGITVDPANGDFYLSSIFKNKIIKVSGGKPTDFIKTGQDGFMGGVGLHIDARRRILWACSGNIMGNKFKRGVHAYDLTTGKLIKKITFPTDTVRKFFNDLVIADDGTVYITDTYNHSVWEWGLTMESPDKKDLDPARLNLDGGLEYPNGVTISPNNEFLFVASAKELRRINLTTYKVDLLPVPAGSVSGAGLDGIEFYKNSIVGVQNGYDKNSDMKIVRYYLNEDLDKIEKVEVIDTGNKHFDIPTTLTISNDVLYVIANSQLSNLDQETIRILAPEKLTQTVVLKYQLK